jgi:hypothetical protein
MAKRIGSLLRAAPSGIRTEPGVVGKAEGRTGELPDKTCPKGAALRPVPPTLDFPGKRRGSASPGSGGAKTAQQPVRFCHECAKTRAVCATSFPGSAPAERPWNAGNSRVINTLKKREKGLNRGEKGKSAYQATQSRLPRFSRAEAVDRWVEAGEVGPPWDEGQGSPSHSRGSARRTSAPARGGDGPAHHENAGRTLCLRNQGTAGDRQQVS